MTRAMTQELAVAAVRAPPQHRAMTRELAVVAVRAPSQRADGMLI
jgi:hypothetical protein